MKNNMNHNTGNITNAEFLKMLFGGCTDGFVTVTTLPGPRTEHIPVRELEKAAERITALGSKVNTYYGTALRGEGLGSSVRGGAGQIRTVVCMYADIDVRGTAHKEENLPESTEEAVGFVNGLAMRPSVTVQSGNGIHALWLLDTPFVIHNEEERTLIREISDGFGVYVIGEGRKRGWKLDNVQDIARMLRAPGSLNFKSDPPKKCEVISAEEIRYPLEAFQEYRRTSREPQETPFQADRGLVGPAERMCGHCAFIDYCIENAPSLPEPVWHGMISNAALAENGQEKVHEWSSSYPGYSYDETEKRYRRAAEINRPCSCRYIRDHFGFECPANGCGVKAPVVFVYYTIEERVEKLLSDTELTLDEVFETKNLLLADYAYRYLPAQFIRLKDKYAKMKVGSRELIRRMKAAAALAASEAQSAEDDFADLGTPLELEGADTAGLFVPGGWDVGTDGVRHECVMNGIPYVKTAFSAPVFIARRLVNIDDGEVKLELEFYCDGHWKKIIVPRGDAMDKGKIVKYANAGLPVTSETAKEAVNYMEAFESRNREAVPLHRSIERMGWIGNKEFFPYRMAGPAVYDGAGEESRRIIEAVAPCGSKELWLDMAAKLRTMHPARVMLAASFASVLLYPLQQRPFIFHLWANSRSGKTAVLKAAVSVYGSPEVLLRSYNSTAVGIERTAGTVKNIPLALDELQSLSMKYDSLSRLTYMLGNGIGKMRGDRTGGTQKMQTWCNIILSTGEQPVTAESSMDGENTRVMELYAAPVEDTDFARKVHQTSAENYGFAGQMFLDYLFREYALEKGPEKLRKAYQDFREEFVSLYEMIYDKCTSIYLEYTAVTAFADYLSSMAVFGLPADKAFGGAWELGSVLLEALRKDTRDNAVDRAWSCVQEWITSNKSHFETKRVLGQTGFMAGMEPLYGRYMPSEEELYILPSVLRKLLKDNGFSYEKSIRGFKDGGYIREKQEQHRVGSKSVKVIVAEMRLDYGGEEDDGEVLLE